LHLAQRKARLDRGDAVESRQLVFQERLIGRQVGGDDAQQIVAVSGHQIALQHLVPFRDRSRETIEVLLLLPRQFDRDEDADMQPKRFLVDGGDVARDHAALSSSSLPRRWQGETDKPTLSASSAMVVRLSACSKLRILRSMASRAFI